tara:strand:- start:112 stop:756 length:645 start_codon:yes stop_codon:yes gene_type:complete
MKNCYTREQIETAVKSKGYKWFEGGQYNKVKKRYVVEYDVNIVGVRNMNTDDKVTNKFDDCMTVSYKDVEGNWLFYCFPCTTDPGKHWVENLLNKNGVAILKEGQYRSSHMIRKHQGKYDALCQKGPLKVYRDKNKDDVYDLLEENVHEGIYGINIHKSGSRETGSTQVDKWSAGCQVFAVKSDFDKFMEIMYAAKVTWGNAFTYTLINSDDIL